MITSLPFPLKYFFFQIDSSLGCDLSKTQANRFQQFILIWLSNVAVILSVNENKFSGEIRTALSGDFSHSLFHFHEKSVNSVHSRLFVPSCHSYSQNMAVKKETSVK